MGDEARASEKGRPWAPRWQRGLLAFFAGAAVLETGLVLLDLHIEWYAGLATYNWRFVLGMSLLPTLAGFVVGIIYGYGGKYLAHFPPLVLLGWHYYESTHLVHQMPPGVYLMPWQLWAFFVIFQMEMSALGAFLGEIVSRRWMSWDAATPQRWADSESLPGEDD